MPFRELINIGGTSVGVTIDKSELRAAGLLDEEGNAVEGQQMIVNQVAPGEWRVEKVDPEQYPALD